MSRKSILKYLLPAALFGTFMGVIFLGSMAIGPRPAKKQMVICYKFNDGLSETVKNQHLNNFKSLKKQSPEILNYSGGFTSDVNENYDVMHYLTFTTEEEITKFKESDAFKSFNQDQKDVVKNELVILAEIK
jgi:hypothetical protein